VADQHRSWVSLHQPLDGQRSRFNTDLTILSPMKACETGDRDCAGLRFGLLVMGWEVRLIKLMARVGSGSLRYIRSREQARDADKESREFPWSGCKSIRGHSAVSSSFVSPMPFVNAKCEALSNPRKSNHGILYPVYQI